MIDTLRILVSWKCNLHCSYCSNEQERFRKDIHPTTLDAIKWDRYKVFCVSGGEPLLNFGLVKQVCERIPQGVPIILYTNGILLGREVANKCVSLGITAVNVGLHYPESFKRIISNVTLATKDTSLSVRFHAQDVYQFDLTQNHPTTVFRFWRLDDCDRDNEHRVVLI